MNIFSRKFRRALPGLAAFVLIFGVAALVILYFLGYYDLSFLDRYKIFEQDNAAAETERDVFSFPCGTETRIGRSFCGNLTRDERGDERSDNS